MYKCTQACKFLWIYIYIYIYPYIYIYIDIYIYMDEKRMYTAALLCQCHIVMAKYEKYRKINAFFFCLY